ncbi:polyprenyl synthetase family protein [Granulosicoccus sp. 3-233]|uniref:polyprenyl synthetase family protein n=1 Tax=Granulosicoccus sp. 3-233 TaxID=3417969 RepID=UPI003D326B14
MSIEDSQALIATGMSRVDELIRQRLASEVVLINQLSSYIIGSGGKRLRPQMVLLAAGACGLDPDTEANPVTVAAIIEFIHTATLLHDDVVDASELRRGRDTANSVWGNEAAVLVGDFLYSRSFEMMVEVQNLQVMSILASTTNRIAEGEVMQLLNVREPGISEAQYIQVIEAKTARLFQAATELGAVLAGESADIQAALASYGMHLGTAFQIADDVLDYKSDSDTMGKNIGDDLAEGKTTLPLIHAMRDGTDAQAAVIAETIRAGGLERLPEVLEIIRQTDALDKSMNRAHESASRAIDALIALPASPYRDALQQIARYSVDRSY